jgi:cell division transport system permease protein
MTVFFKNEANDSFKSFWTEKQALRKSIDYVTKEQAAKQHTDIIEKIYDFPWWKSITKFYDIHLKLIMSKR